MATRICRQRAKGWRMPDGAVYVGRPSRWGNPWRIERAPYGLHAARRVWRRTEAGLVYLGTFNADDAARSAAARGYWLAMPDGFVDVVRCELAGRDLVCWCPLDQPCHADVLLEMANGGVSS